MSAHRRIRTHRLHALTAVAVLCTGTLVFAGSAAAKPGLSINFAAAAPLTYNHSTGGGAWDQGAIGISKDVVEQLEQANFACNDIVSFLMKVEAPAGPGGPETLTIDLTFGASTTGQPGAAYTQVVGAAMNYGNVGGNGPGGTDSAISDNGDSVASVTSQEFTAMPFTSGAELVTTIAVTNVAPGETTVVRIDVTFGCDGRRPTGNLLAGVDGARWGGDRVNVGRQTVPMKPLVGMRGQGAVIGECDDPEECADLLPEPVTTTTRPAPAPTTTVPSTTTSSSTSTTTPPTSTSTTSTSTTTTTTTAPPGGCTVVVDNLPLVPVKNPRLLGTGFLPNEGPIDVVVTLNGVPNNIPTGQSADGNGEFLYTITGFSPVAGDTVTFALVSTGSTPSCSIGPLVYPGGPTTTTTSTTTTPTTTPATTTPTTTPATTTPTTTPATTTPTTTPAPTPSTAGPVPTTRPGGTTTTLPRGRQGVVIEEKYEGEQTDGPPDQTYPACDVTLVDDNATPDDPADDALVPLQGLTDVDNDGSDDDLAIDASFTGTRGTVKAQDLGRIAFTGTFSGSLCNGQPAKVLTAVTFTVDTDPDAGRLPRTGSNALVPAAVGGTLVIGGTLLLLRRRRRILATR